jgi:adenosylcobinamide-phosphate synthase
MPHPVRFMGWLIEWGENFLRKRFQEKVGGAILTAGLIIMTFLATFIICHFSSRLNKFLGLAVCLILGYTTISVKSLLKEAAKVKGELLRKNLSRARINLSHLVARDTYDLSEKEVIRATVESVAENTTDGIIAPLFYLAIGGVPLAMTYKAINTLDSMIGYQNERYITFGRLAAIVDEVANFIPARISILVMALAAWCSGLDHREGFRFIKREAFKGDSLNSTLTEGVAAFLLGVRLGGLNYYQGKPYERPFLGEEKRPLEIEDINRLSRLAFLSGLILVVVALLIKLIWK